MSDEMAELKKRLKEAFEVATKLYQERGFQRRIGFGRKPALVNVDLANAWTRPGNPFTCDDIDDQIIPGVQRLLEACRANNHLVVHVTTCYQNTDREDPHTDMGMWHHKVPVEAVDQGKPELWAIDSRIAPVEGEAKGLGEDHVVFDEVARRSWEDRVSLEIKPLGDGRIMIDQYPFDESPLTVTVPARVAEPHTWWHQAPRILKQFTFLRK